MAVETGQRIHFYFPTKAAATTDFTFKAPEFSDPEEVDLQQVIDNSGGNKLLALDRGETLYVLAYDFDQLTLEDRDNLFDFFKDTVIGARKTFELVVPRYEREMRAAWGLSPGMAYHYTACQFEQSALSFPRNVDGFSTSFRIRATGRSAIPAT